MLGIRAHATNGVVILIEITYEITGHNYVSSVIFIIILYYRNQARNN